MSFDPTSSGPSARPRRRAGAARLLFWALLALCAASVLADVFYHPHVHYAVEEIPGAYGIMGLLAGVLVVLIARPLRRLLAREEDYYGDV